MDQGRRRRDGVSLQSLHDKERERERERNVAPGSAEKKNAAADDTARLQCQTSIRVVNNLRFHVMPRGG